MQSWFAGALVDLHFAGAAFGHGDLERSVAHGGNDIDAGAEAGAVVVAIDAPHAGHAAATFFEPPDANLRDQAHQVFGGRTDAERAEVARHVVADREPLRYEIEQQATALVELPQVMAGFLSVLGDGERVFVVVEQDRILVRQREHGRRLGGDDREALSHVLGKHRHVLFGDGTGGFHGTGGDHRHTGLLLIFGHVNGDAIVPQNGHQRVGNLCIEMIGVGIDEINNLFAAGSWAIMKAA